MRAFVRQGYQLAHASFETRLTYSAFLTVTLAGAGTMFALGLGRLGVRPSAIATAYRGSDEEMRFPKEGWQLLEATHAHAFAIPVLLLVLTHLAFATPLAPRTKLALTALAWAGAAGELVGPYLVRYVAAAFAWLLLASWAALGSAIVAMVALPLWHMWRAPSPGQQTP